MVTAVPTEATVTPMIWIEAEALSLLRSCAVAMAEGPEATSYGGVPPLMTTVWLTPTPTATEEGTAVNCGVVVC